MLQQKGWSEGEALGASAPRRTLTQKALEKRPARTILSDRELLVKTEEREVALDEDDEVREVRKVEVVDLTLSDSDEDMGEDDDDAFVDAEVDPSELITGEGEGPELSDAGRVRSDFINDSRYRPY